MEVKKNFIEVLLVEDNEDDANLAIRELRKNKLANNLLHLTDGEQAINYLFAKGRYSKRDTTNTPKVILLDLKMPKIGGLEVLKAIRGNKITKKIPVVVLTSSKEEQDITESYNLGVNSYIVKPVDFPKFAQSIKEIGYYWIVLNEIKY